MKTLNKLSLLGAILLSSTSFVMGSGVIEQTQAQGSAATHSQLLVFEHPDVRSVSAPRVLANIHAKVRSRNNLEERDAVLRVPASSNLDFNWLRELRWSLVSLADMFTVYERTQEHYKWSPYQLSFPDVYSHVQSCINAGFTLEQNYLGDLHVIGPVKWKEHKNVSWDCNDTEIFSLCRLDVSGHPFLATLPDSLWKNPNLKSINIVNTRIKDLDLSQQINLDNIAKLPFEICKNQKTTIIPNPNNHYRMSPSALEVILGGNGQKPEQEVINELEKINTLPEEFFQNLTNTIDLSGTSIQCIDLSSYTPRDPKNPVTLTLGSTLSEIHLNPDATYHIKFLNNDPLAITADINTQNDFSKIADFFRKNVKADPDGVGNKMLHLDFKGDTQFFQNLGLDVSRIQLFVRYPTFSEFDPKAYRGEGVQLRASLPKSIKICDTRDPAENPENSTGNPYADYGFENRDDFVEYIRTARQALDHLLEIMNSSSALSRVKSAANGTVNANA